MIIEPIDELAGLLSRSAEVYAEAMDTLAHAIVKHDPEAIEKAMRELSQMTADTLALADLIGRKRLLMEVDEARNKTALLYNFGGVRFANAIFPRIPFIEALEDLVAREPRLAQSAEEVKRAYGTGGFALGRFPSQLANDARLALTRRIHQAIGDLAEQGVSGAEAGQVLAEMGGFSQSYGESVYRTTMSGAYSNGRLRQALIPEVREVVPAFEYEATGDGDTRKNHEAADGLIAAVTDPIWNRQAPPQGHG